ncbi:MAG: thioredoxin family protein [Planctomycetes bacterium]|nr:thioredoxin family protein [Planctomycetota bacterium]
MKTLVRSFAAAAACLAILGGTRAQEPARKQQAPIYDTKADAKALVGAALKLAQRDGKRVLVMFGGNWCGWCHKLHGLFQSNDDVRTLLRAEYELVLVDIGSWDKHMDLAASWGADLKKHGVPYLTVLDADGKPITNQDTSSLETGDAHEPAKVIEFLTTNKAELRVAEDVLAAARATADKTDRRLLVHFGAPWCGWCHRLEDFLAIPGIAAAISKDYVDVKIDEDRMVGGKELEARIRKGRKGGIPWLLIAEPDLTELATSDSEAGNIGYPAKASEIEHFMTMLAATRRNLTDEDVALIRTTLEARAKEIEEANERARREAEAKGAKRDG